MIGRFVGLGVGGVWLGFRVECGLAVALAMALVFENDRGERRVCGDGV